MAEDARAEQSIAKILRVPGKYRNFYINTQEADKRYAIKGPVLEMLLDLGLPHSSRGTHLYFDNGDLSNLCLDLKLPGVQWRFMRLWPRFLDLARQGTGTAYEFTVRTVCPRPGHTGQCSFQFNTEFAEHIVGIVFTQHSCKFQGAPISEDYDFGASIDSIITEARRLQFHVLPDELSRDMNFLTESGLADCQSANLWLTEVAARHGIKARPATGIFLSVPFSVMHVWLEIRVADQWKHADPFFLNTLARWEILQLSDWPLSRSPKAAILYLASGQVGDHPLVWHGDDWGHTGPLITREIRSTDPGLGS